MAGGLDVVRPIADARFGVSIPRGRSSSDPAAPMAGIVEMHEGLTTVVGAVRYRGAVRTYHGGFAGSATRHARSRMRSRSSASTRAPGRPRLRISSRPRVEISTSRLVWRSTPRRRSRPAMHDSTSDQWMRRSTGDHLACQASARRPVRTCARNVGPPSTRSTTHRGHFGASGTFGDVLLRASHGVGTGRTSRRTSRA